MKLYHINEEDLNGQILQPRIPDNFLTKQGYEDNKTPRISLCKSVNGCLTAISANLKNKVFNVYLIDESYAIPNIKEITNNEVPDQSLTEEVWVLNPIKLKYGFKIRVLGAYPKSLKYKYGKDWAETYRWKYNVIDDSDVMTKDKALFILKECFIQVKDIDKKGYVKGVGLFGSTARDQRTKESDVDIFLDLDQSLLKLEENSIFGIPKKDWEVILKVFVDNFGVNPHTNKNYVIDVVGKYELRHKWNEAKDEIIMIDTDGKKYTYDEYVNSKNVVEVIKLNEFNNFIDSDDFEYNLDRWKKKEIKFLFITGLSGSGKSTLARNLSKKYKSKYIELDSTVDSNIASINFIDTVDGGIEAINNMSKEEYEVAVVNFIFNLYPSEQVIVEGIGILEWFDGIPNIKKHAFIIRGTSRLTSSLRAAKRDGMALPNVIKNLFKNRNAYKYHKRRSDELKSKLSNEKRMIESTSNVKFSTPEELYKFLVEETEFSVHKRRLQTIDEIWKSRKLDCWEAVDFQDYYLKQMSVVKNVRRIYISYLMKDRYKYPENGEHDPVIIDNEKYYWVSDGSHSVSMFEYKNKVYYLEVANRMKQGLYEFNSWKEAITFLYKEFTSESRKDIHMIDKLVIFDYTNIDIPRRFTNSHFEANSQYINAVFKGKMLYEKDIQKKIKESVDNQHDFIRDVLFDRIKNIFKTKFGWNVDYMKFKYTDVPRYNNNKPNPNMFIDEFGGCHTKHPYNTIYLSTALDRTIKYYKLNMSKVEFASIIIAHELAHEVHMYFLTTQQREEYYKHIPTEFWSVYLDRVKKDQPEKINEELFCEYIANLVFNYLKQNNMWKESMLKASTNILYHGSPVQNLKIIEPRILFTPDQKDIPRVFAANKKIVALMFLHKRGTPLGMGEVDGNWYIKEKEPNAFDGYKIKGSIYTIKNESFTKLDSGFDEYVSYEPVEVIKEEQYDNVWNVLLQLEKTKQLRLIRYNDTTYDEYETINSGIFYVDKSTIEEGNGTFAKKDIKKNTKIAVAFIKTNNTGDMNRDYKSTILGEYTKHSNTPNLNIRKNNEKIVFYSNRFIKKDEELTVNYKQFDWVWKKDFVETCIKRGDKTVRILKEFELNTQADPITLDEVTRRLYTAFDKIKEIDDKEYILNLGIYGSTAKGTRTKKSPIDIYVFLNPNTIQKPIINDERIQNSLFGVPNAYWEPMRDILVDAFGINPFTKKPYVINVMSEYEVRNKKDNIYDDMLVLKGKRLVRYKVLYSETVKKNLKVPFLIETTVLNFPQVRQSTDYSCGASAVRAVLVYYGKDIREDQLIQTMHTSKENGTDPKNMMQYLRKQAFKVDFGTMTVQKLKEYIDKKIPVIVLIQAWADDKKEYKKTLDNGHYAVVIGYTDTKFLFEDPSIYERGYLTFDEFEKRWKDISSEGKIYTKCGIAVYGAEPKYSEEKFIKIE